MNSTYLRAAAATLLAGTGLVVLTATDGSASAARQNHVLTVSVRTVGSSQLGDRYLVESDKVTRNGKTIGYTANSCTFDFAAGLAHCLVTMARPQGQLRAKVTVNAETNQIQGRVVGGTGAYRGATGTVTGGNGPQPGTQVITLRWQD